MKAGDKFIEAQTYGFSHDAFTVIIHTVKQMSKDGLKMKAENDDVFSISSVILSYEQIKSTFESLFGKNGVLFGTKTSSAGWVKDIQEDDFDDITHVEATNASGVSFQGNKLNDNDESMNGEFKYFLSVEKFAEYLSGLAGFEKPHKISDWLERHGYFEQEVEFCKSYNEKDLLYAADNNIHPQDFEHWQTWKKVLKGRFLSYEDAMALENTLEKITDGLTIYDYE